eukprot:6083391-Prymnesium_polylepis.1
MLKWDHPAQETTRPTIDWNGREMKRMSQLLRADEPLEEELHGLAGLGAFVGLTLGGQFLGSEILGMILGVQLAPALGFIEGTRGDHVRAAGWRAARCSAGAAFEVRRAIDAADRLARWSGATKLVRTTRRRTVRWLRTLDERAGARAKALALTRRLGRLCLA